MKSLKEIEYLYNNMTTCETIRLKPHLEIIEKELKSLEIIKNKVGVHWNEILPLWLRNKLINQEEYELLKEVLL